MAPRPSKKPAATAPKQTVYDVHVTANDNGFGYYHVVVLRMPEKRLHNGHLWLRIEDVKLAKSRKQIPFRDSTREEIMLNITNALHWNPMPQGRRLPWSRIKLVRVDPPPRAPQP